MDPATVVLATKVIAVLAPFVAKGAEEFASKVGEAAFEKAKAILTALKKKWSKDEDATATLALFEKKPERYETALQDVLQEKLSQDEHLKEQLSHIIEGMGPTIEVLQQMKKAEQVKGATFGDVKSGIILHKQDIEEGKDIVGPTFGSVG
jgi:hypothetical protein